MEERKQYPIKCKICYKVLNSCYEFCRCLIDDNINDNRFVKCIDCDRLLLKNIGRCLQCYNKFITHYKNKEYKNKEYNK